MNSRVDNASREHRLDVEGLSVRYPGTSMDALRSIDLSISPDRPLVVLGADGAGKSTLLASLAGLVPEVTGGTVSGQRRLSLRDGRVLVLGPGNGRGGDESGRDAVGDDGRGGDGGVDVGRPDEAAEAWLERCALLMDDPQAQISGARARVDEEVALALEYRGVARAEMRIAVDQALQTAGIAHLRARHPAHLSVGEAARVAFAAVCIAQPALALFDEPTAHLDARGREHVLGRIRDLWRSGTLVALATQAIDEVDDGTFLAGGGTPLCAEALVLLAGESILAGTAESVFAALDLHSHGVAPSTRALAKSLAPTGSAAQTLGREQGSLLSPTNLSADLSKPDVPVDPATAVLSGVSAARPDGTQCLRDVDLTFSSGEIAALIGANGAGKTSLAHALIGLLPVSGGKILIAGSDVTQRMAPHRSDLVGLAFQRPEDQLFERTVEREVAFGPRCKGRTGPELSAAVHRALELCGLLSARHLHPYDLTRAGRRWVGLASTLALETPIVVLDEPTVGLDHGGVERLKAVLDRLRAAGCTVIVISHDLDFVGEMADRVAVMSEGRVIVAGTARSVLTDEGPLERADLAPAVAVALGKELGIDGGSGPPLCRRALYESLRSGSD